MPTRLRACWPMSRCDGPAKQLNSSARRCSFVPNTLPTSLAPFFQWMAAIYPSEVPMHSNASSASSEFAGRVAFLTGAGSGIGAATARLLARQGAAVVIGDIDEAAARRVAGEL